MFEDGLQEAVEQAKQLSPEAQVEFVLEAAATLGNRLVRSDDRVAKPVSALLRKKLPFTPAQILQLVERGADPSYYFPFPSVLRLAESVPMTPELEQALRRMRTARVLQDGYVQGHRGIIARIDELLKPKADSAPFEPAGAWSSQIANELTPAWRSVLETGRDVS